MVAIEELMERTWLFITGMPRSGTTLAVHLLNLHPDCHILLETSPATSCLKAVEPGVEGRNMYCKAIMEGRWTEERVEIPWLLPRITYEADTLDIARRMTAGIRSAFPDAIVFGDKNPDYGQWWPDLRRMFPECRFLVMDRDLKATVDSIMRQAHWWEPTMRKTRDVAKKWATNRRTPMLECPGAEWVRLEDLEAEPRNTIKRMLVYAGLEPGTYPWEKALERFEPGAKKVN